VIACRHISFFALFLLYCAVSPSVFAGERKGIWTGDFTFVGGSNFHSGAQFERLFTRGETELSGKLGYKSKQWDISIDFENKYDNTVTFASGLTYDVKNDDEYKVYVDTTVRTGYNEQLNFGVSINYRPSHADRFNVYYSGRYNLEEPRKTVVSAVFNQDTEWSEPQIYRFTSEESELVKMKNGFGGIWDHKFASPSQTLTVRADASFLFDNRLSAWAMGNFKEDNIEGYQIEEMTRDTPRYKTQFVGMRSIFSETRLGNVKGLQLEGMLDVLFNRNFDDLCKEKYIEPEWVDTLTIKEKFDYVTLTVDPRVRLKYIKGKFDFFLEYCPEFYAYKLSSDKYFGSMQTSRLAHLAGVGLTYLPNEHHQLKLTAGSTIKRPTYLNLCWFRRSGTYANEFIEGNPDLLPETSNKMMFLYEFRWGRFSAIASVGDTYAFDKIEKTFNNVDVEDRSYRIYTWINAGWSNTLNGTLTARWKGQSLFAELSGSVNQVNNMSKDNKSKKSMDYKLSGKLKYKLKTWAFEVNGNYRSEVYKIYSYMTRYIGLSARVDKKLGKFSVFAEGRDLLDHPIETITYSEDFMHGRGEKVDNTRRSFLIGVRFKF